jgi:hypothetical protein
MKITDLLCLIIIAISFVSCQKKNTDSEFTKITFTMPDLSGGQPQYSSHILNQRSNVSDPTTINQVNCFALMVSGPDPFLNRTSCPIEDGNSTNIGNLTVGIIAGLIPRNNQLTIFVPAGPKRKFYLVGVKADPITACVNFGDPNASAEFTSSQLIIGESSQVDLPPGIEVTVPIKIASSGTAIGANDRRLGTCVGPDSPSNKGKIFPTKVTITKNSFPINAVTNNTSNCNQLEINFVDDKGELGQNQNPIRMKLQKMVLPAGTISDSNVYTDPLCTNNIFDGVSFTVGAFIRTLPVFVNVGTPGSVSGVKYAATPVISPYPQFITEMFPLKFNNQAASADIFGPRRVLPDMCYNFTSNFRFFNKTLTDSASVTVNLADIETRVFPGFACANAPISSGTVHLVNLGLLSDSFNFSAKFSQTYFANTYFTLTPHVTSATENLPARYNLQVVGGSRNPSFLRPEGPFKIPPNTLGCFGPFQAIIENERGGAIVTDGDIIPTTPSTLASHLGVKSDSNCIGAFQTQVLTDYRKVFYVHVSSTAISAGTPVQLAVHGEIEHPDRLNDLNSVASMTTKVFLNFNN